MIRTWGFQELNGNAQPWFGDKITAAFVNLKAPNGFYFVTVANASRYQIGDRIIIGVASGSPTNCLLVGGVNTVTNVLSCTSEGDAPISAWPVNTQLMLDIACFEIILTGKSGNAASVWVGADSTVTNSGGGSAFYEIGKVSAGAVQSPFSIKKYSGQNPLRSSEGWVAGANADYFSAALVIN